MEQIKRSELEGEAEGLDEEGFFFLLALRDTSREASSCLLQFLVWGVLAVGGGGEEAEKDSFSAIVMRSPDNFTRREHTHLGIA